MPNVRRPVKPAVTAKAGPSRSAGGGRVPDVPSGVAPGARRAARRFRSVGDLVAFALGREEEASDFYMDLARRSDDPVVAHTLEGFAREERRHAAKLRRLFGAGAAGACAVPAGRLPVREYAEALIRAGEFDYEKALVVAMAREKVSYRLYMDLSRALGAGTLSRAVQVIAREEAAHKLWVETELDALRGDGFDRIG